MAIDYQYHRQSSHRIQILNSFFCLHLFILFGKFPKLPPQASDLSFSKCPQKGQILHKYLNPKLQLPLSSCDCKGKYFSFVFIVGYYKKRYKTLMYGYNFD